MQRSITEEVLNTEWIRWRRVVENTSATGVEVWQKQSENGLG